MPEDRPLRKELNGNAGGVLESKRIHPLAALIPEMDADQFTELRDDIATHGLIEAIVLHEDMVLDGRHRYRACIETGAEPRFTEFNGPSPVEFVLSVNVKRRHLTPSQRAAIAVEFLPAIEAEARERQRVAGQTFGRGMDSLRSPDHELSTDRGHKAREDAGALVGVSGATVDRAKRVQREDPEMFEQVKAGTLPVRTADTQLRERARNGTVTRDGHRRRPPHELVGNVIEKLLGISAALDEIDTAGAIAGDNVPLVQWDKDLTDIIVPLNRLRGEIRKVLSDG